MQQIYRKRPIHKCGFNKVAYHFYMDRILPYGDIGWNLLKGLILPSLIRIRSIHGLNKPVQLKCVAVLGESLKLRSQNPNPKMQSKKETCK